MRTWPELGESKAPTLAGFIGFKAGMLHIITVDDRENTPNYGKPLFNAATVLALPTINVFGIRVYGYEDGYYKALYDVFNYSDRKVFKREVEAPSLEDQLKRLDELRGKIEAVSCHVYIVPRDVGLSQKKPIIMEIPVVGGTIDTKLDYAKSLLGKKVDPSQLVKPGEYVDVLGITKGKGFAGPVKRFGIKRKQHKARKTVREVGAIGSRSPAAVTYTVPRAGQHGFHQRTEYNHRILMVGDEKENPITPKGGFPHFGVIRGKYIVLKGSLPGPPKRPIIVRLPLRPKPVSREPPKILLVSTQFKRG